MSTKNLSRIFLLVNVYTYATFKQHSQPLENYLFFTRCIWLHHACQTLNHSQEIFCACWQTVAVDLFFNKLKTVSVSPPLSAPHWSNVAAHIKFKSLKLIYSLAPSIAPTNINSFMQINDIHVRNTDNEKDKSYHHCEAGMTIQTLLLCCQSVLKQATKLGSFSRISFCLQK